MELIALRRRSSGARFEVGEVLLIARNFDLCSM